MSTDDLAKEITIALINQGYFQYTDDKSSHKIIIDKQISNVCNAYTEIYKTIKECSVK